MPTIGIQSKPVVDEEALEKARIEEEEKAAKIAEKLNEEPDEGETEEQKAARLKKEAEDKKKKDEVDYEAKFKESQKEALVLKAQLDKIEEEKQKKVEITDDYLKGKYQDWDDLTTGEQRAIRKSEELEQEIAEIKNNANKFNNDREWQQKVEVYTTENLPDEFPDIVGREEEFKRFATKPSRKGLPMDDLAKIFLHDNPKPQKRTSLFHAPGNPNGSGQEETGMTADDIRTLRVTRPVEYMRLVRAGKIKIKI